MDAVDRRRALALTLTAPAALAACALAPPPRTVRVHGHRGARGLAPENTLPAFEHALALGVRTLELDVVLTRDDVLVVHHDLRAHPDIARDAQGRWLGALDAPLPAIRSLTWAEVRAWDVGRLRPGSRYGASQPAQVPRDGTRVPRLADVFAWVAARPDAAAVRFSIETKLDPRQPDAGADPEAFAAALVDAVGRHGLLRRVEVQSFDWRSLRAVQRLAPRLPTVCLTAQQPFLDNVQAGAEAPSPWTAGLAWRDHGSVPRMVRAFGGSVWSPHHGDLSAALVQEAHALGLSVTAWTVNDPALLDRVVGFGIDAVVTDRPDLVLPALARLGVAAG